MNSDSPIPTDLFSRTLRQATDNPGAILGNPEALARARANRKKGGRK